MTHSANWEMGSEFHLFTGSAKPASNHLPFQGECFVNGRAALRSIVEAIETESRNCWIPSYICAEVYNVLTAKHKLKVYGDYPDESAPRFDTLTPEPDDIVLIQDTFGLGNVDQWQEWKYRNPGVRLVEDISHNSTQERYLQSPADHVFSSIRKSLPVADGGLVFSREGGLQKSSQASNDGARYKLEAMILKSLYLAGHPVEKQSFRDLQVAGESDLNNVDQGASLTHSDQMLIALPHESLRLQWRANNQQLRNSLHAQSFKNLLQVLRPRNMDAGLFHIVVRCRDQDVRDKLRSHLIANSVFPAVHWSQGHNPEDERAVELTQLLLTLPTDFRYGFEDIDRLAAILWEGLAKL